MVLSPIPALSWQEATPAGPGEHGTSGKRWDLWVVVGGCALKRPSRIIKILHGHVTEILDSKLNLLSFPRCFVPRLTPARLHSAMVQEDSDSESGLPETVPLSTSASAAKRHEYALRNFHAAEKRKIREKNRQHDERLKAQHMRRRVTATSRKGRLYVGYHGLETGDNEGGREMDPRLHERMTRAMGDAENEMEEVDSGSESKEEWGGIKIAKIANEDGLHVVADQDAEMLRSEGEEKTRSGDLDSGDGEGDEDDGLGVQQPLASPSKYLPDDVFVAALSKPKNAVRPSQTTLKTRPSRNRQSVRAREKDVVVGWVSIPHFSILFLFPLFYESDPFLSTRTVRTLSSSPASARLESRGTTLPPARINKFLANALGFKRKSNTVSTFPHRWERRPCTSYICPTNARR